MQPDECRSLIAFSLLSIHTMVKEQTQMDAFVESIRIAPAETHSQKETQSSSGSSQLIPVPSSPTRSNQPNHKHIIHTDTIVPLFFFFFFFWIETGMAVRSAYSFTHSVALRSRSGTYHLFTHTHMDMMPNKTKYTIALDGTTSISCNRIKPSEVNQTTWTGD